MLFLGTELGGVTLTSGNVIQRAKALQLTYNLRFDTNEENEKALAWEKAFLNKVENFDSNNLKVYRFALSSLNEELDTASRITLVQVAIVSVVIVIFFYFGYFYVRLGANQTNFSMLWGFYSRSCFGVYFWTACVFEHPLRKSSWGDAISYTRYVDLI